MAKIIDNDVICPMCECSVLKNITHESQFNYKGISHSISQLNSTACKKCDFEFILPQQKIFNESLIRKKRREIDNILSAEEIKILREKLELTQEDAAIIFGGGKHAFSKYERGEVVQSIAMDRLMRVAFEIPEAFSVIAGFSASERKVTFVRNIIDELQYEIIDESHRTSIRFSSVKKKRELEINFNNVIIAA